MGKKKKVDYRESEKKQNRAEIDSKVQEKSSLSRQEAYEYYRMLLGSIYYKHSSKCDSYFDEIWYAINGMDESVQRKKIMILTDMLKAEIRSLETMYKEEIEIAGITFRKGDTVEIGVGRQRYIGTFLGFDRQLYVISIKCEDNEMVIPYKNLKYMRKVKSA